MAQSLYGTEKATSYQIGFDVEEMVSSVSFQRRPFERRWYDNNFFDDGYHYRYISRTTGKIVDLSQMGDSFIPHRAIPESSRQIRGVINLMLANPPTPVVYPEKISMTQFPGQTQYEQALKDSQTTSSRIGIWITNEWRNQHFYEKLIYMLLLAAKNSVSFMKIWPDAEREEICTSVRDAFDVYIRGEFTNIYDTPYMVEAYPKLISKIKTDKNFDEDQKMKLNPDNRYATSEIKEAYMRNRFGMLKQSDNTATLMLKEGYIKEIITEDNADKVKKDLGKDFKGKDIGSPIIRQVFEAAGVWLSDKYLNIEKYPYVDFRFEPGPIYQTPFIERLIPSNKSLDAVVSRVERHIGNMAVGAYMIRKGENFNITNVAGGLKLEYVTTPPVQMPMAPLPPQVFEFINLMQSFINRQGANTSTSSNPPTGIKSGVAIESVKASEFANLKISTDQTKESVRNIAERMIDIAANYYIKPKTVYNLKDGKPDYFDVIGERGMNKFKEMQGKNLGQAPQAIPISKDIKVDIEIESGLGFTEEGKRNTMTQITTFLQALAEKGYVTQEAVSVVVKKFLDVFKFGATQEFMEGMETGSAHATEQDLTKMKIAILEALKEAGEIGLEASENRIMENKVGTIEAMKESGLADKMMLSPIQDNPEVDAIPYKDAPEDIKRQMEEKAGLKPSTGVSPAGTDQLTKVTASLQSSKEDKNETKTKTKAKK